MTIPSALISWLPLSRLQKCHEYEPVVFRWQPLSKAPTEYNKLSQVLPHSYKGPHTHTSLASESGWARVPRSQTCPCVECHEPDLADSGLARQGLRWGSARRRLAIGSYVCGRSQARLMYPHGHKHRQCEFCH